MLRNQRGVTLVEIIIALGIVGVLASTVVFGRDQLRTKQQFSQSVDQLVETLSNIRNQASGTVGQTGANGGTSLTEDLYGKLVTIDTTGKITVANETVDHTTDSMVYNNDVGTDKFSVQIPWNTHPSTTLYLLFGLDSGGTVHAYYLPGGYTRVSGGFPPNTSPTYGQTPGGTSFIVQDNANPANRAQITVDQYGNVSRVFL